MSSFNTHQELHDNAILDECNVQSEKIKKSDMLKTQYIKKLSEAQIIPKEVTISGNCSEIESKQSLKTRELNWKGKTKDSLKTKIIF